MTVEQIFSGGRSVQYRLLTSRHSSLKVACVCCEKAVSLDLKRSCVALLPRCLLIILASL